MANYMFVDFLIDPLVTWFLKCLEQEHPVNSMQDLIRGNHLHQVFLRIGPWKSDALLEDDETVETQIHNIQVCLRNIQRYFEHMGIVILKLPDAVKIGENAGEHVSEIRLLLLLILYAAVTCENTEYFVTRIREMLEKDQLAIMGYVEEVKEPGKFLFYLEKAQGFDIDDLLFVVKNVAEERDEHLEAWANFMKRKGERGIFAGGDPSEMKKLRDKIKKLRQELDHHRNALDECNDETKTLREVVAKSREENKGLMIEARRVKLYRDEIDELRLQVERIAPLEMDISKYRKQVEDLEYHQMRVKELQRNNEALKEAMEVQEKQLAVASRETGKVKNLEDQVKDYKNRYEELSVEHEAQAKHFAELCAENSKLELMLSSSFNTSKTELFVATSSKNNSLSEEMNESEMSNVLRLESENRQLRITVESMKLMDRSQKSDDLEKYVDEYKAALKEIKEEKIKLERQLEEFQLKNKDLRLSLDVRKGSALQSLQDMRQDVGLNVHLSKVQMYKSSDMANVFI